MRDKVTDAPLPASVCMYDESLPCPGYADCTHREVDPGRFCALSPSPASVQSADELLAIIVKSAFSKFMMDTTKCEVAVSIDGAGKWSIVESTDGGPEGCSTTGRVIYIVAAGGIVAQVMPCASPRAAFGDDGLPDCGNTPGTYGYDTGLDIARATAREIVDAHNAQASQPFLPF